MTSLLAATLGSSGGVCGGVSWILLVMVGAAMRVCRTFSAPTGESVPNDVEEEVYEGEIAEPPVAGEASDGDRRAVAVADQAGQP